MTANLVVHTIALVIIRQLLVQKIGKDLAKNMLIVCYRKLIKMESLYWTTCLINSRIKKDIFAWERIIIRLGEDNYETIVKMRQYY